MTLPGDSRRFSLSLGVSALVHALAFAVVLPRLSASSVVVHRPAPLVFPISLVSLPGGGGGGPKPGPPAPGPDTRVAEVAPSPVPVAAPPPVETLSPPKPAARPKPAPPPKTVARPRPTPPAAQVASAPRLPAEVPPGATAGTSSDAASGASGARDVAAGGGGRGGPGTGDGSGGDGSGGARPAYGTNPKPPYPLAARRLGLEGVVVLEVLVRADGSPAEVSVRKSSGHAMLDDSALTTVRTRWRFIPARRGSVPVDDRVTFPVRFNVREG